MDPNESFDAMYQALMFQQQQDQQQQQQQQQLQQQHSWRVQLMLQQQRDMMTGQEQQSGEGGPDVAPPGAERGAAPLHDEGGARQVPAPEEFASGNFLAYYETTSRGALGGSRDLSAAAPSERIPGSLPQQYDPMSFLDPRRDGRLFTAPEEDRLLSRLGAPPYSQHLVGAVQQQPVSYLMMSPSTYAAEESSRLLLQTAPANHPLLALNPNNNNSDSYNIAMYSAQEYLTSSGDAPGRSGGAPPAAPSAALRGESEKERFVMFVTILLKLLDRHGGDGSDGGRGLKAFAKATILECTRRNRMGDASYTPLLDAIETRLRGAVGDAHWSRALRLCNRYFERRRATRGGAIAIPLAAV